MFLSRFCLSALFISGLVGCGSQLPEATYTSTGLIADQGAIRIWRKDYGRQPSIILSVYSPYNGTSAVIGRYEYLDGKLSQVNEVRMDELRTKVQLRFDADNHVSYMQRQQGAVKTSLTEDDISRYHYESQQLVELSGALNVGRITLVQGKWQDGRVTTCEGKHVSLPIDAETFARATNKISHPNEPFNVAWLEGPEGTQLLLATNEAVCQWSIDKPLS